MTPRLELVESNHTRILVAPPRINLRRAKSYNAQDRGPLSSTSSRFNFNHLLFSPPPSPSLPSLIPRPKRTGSDLLRKSRPSRVLRLTFGAAILFSTLYIIPLFVRHKDPIQAIWPYFTEEDYEMVGQDILPDFPTPIVVSDARGRSRWTVSIPPSHVFPLSTQAYAEMSSQCHEVSSRARDLHHKAPLIEKYASRYDVHDEYYVDVEEAERTGLLSYASGMSYQKDSGHFVGLNARTFSLPVCQSSMTYVLESTDAGMGNNLMMMWTFYALAKEQGREFFIEDSRWAYGDYEEIFEAPPAPYCRPPPRHHMVPCPFQARHLVVSGMTAKDVFPSLLEQHHRKVGGSGDEVRDLWTLARKGYEDLFKLNKGDREYVDYRIQELAQQAKKGVTVPNAPIVGLHVRRGDRHPLEYQYRETYIPAEVFHENAEMTAKAQADPAPIQTTAQWSKNEPIVLLASDDPTVHNEPDFSSTLLAQGRIRLAFKDESNEANKHHQYLHRFTDEAFGWEGGFFAPMFWNLGVNTRNNAAEAPNGVVVDEVNEQARLMAPPSEKTLQLRSLIGRAYMMDLAVLAGASDSIVCAVSAMGCRLLGVMMPWEKGVGGKGWVNVDGEYGWAGIDW